MFVRPRMLSILTTRRCTAACDHCCVGASPRAREAIPVQRMHGLIDEAARVPSIELTGFTGGECFLLGRDLDELVDHARRRGFRTRVVSNAYWAVSAEAAAKRIDGLHACGLDEMMLSTGTFHERFVPMSRVITAATAAANAGIPTRISVEVCDQSSFDEASLRAQLADLVSRRRVFIARDAWSADPDGRGATALTHERLLADEPDRSDGPCAQILNVVSVTPSQQLIACCGQSQEHLPRLQLGSVADRALDELLGETQPELMKMWLHVAGPVAIARFVSQYIPDFELRRTATICEACVALQRDERAMRVLEDHARDAVSAVAADFARMQAGLNPIHTTSWNRTA